MAEVDDALGADHIAGPFSIHELIELVEVERPATIINERRDTIFLSLTLPVMVMMVVAMAMLVVLMLPVLMLPVLMMVFMFMVFVTVMVLLIVLMMMLVFIFKFIQGFLDFGYPCGRCGCLLEIKQMSVEQI